MEIILYIFVCILKIICTCYCTLKIFSAISVLLIPELKLDIRFVVVDFSGAETALTKWGRGAECHLLYKDLF